MNTELIITVIACAAIYELSRLLIRILLTLFFQKEHVDSVKNSQLSIKQKLQISKINKKLKKTKQ